MTTGRPPNSPLGHTACDAASDTSSEGDLLRCGCGSLLARYVGGHVELKCRRCKRTVMVPVTNREAADG